MHCDVAKGRRLANEPPGFVFSDGGSQVVRTNHRVFFVSYEHEGIAGCKNERRAIRRNERVYECVSPMPTWATWQTPGGCGKPSEVKLDTEILCVVH